MTFHVERAPMNKEALSVVSSLSNQSAGLTDIFGCHMSLCAVLLCRLVLGTYHILLFNLF